MPINAIGLGSALALLVTSDAVDSARFVLVALQVWNFATGVWLILRRGAETPVPDRRRYLRLMVEMDAALGSSPCRIQDLSLGGARVVIEDHSAPRVGEAAVLALDLAGERFELRCSVRRRLEHGYHTRVGLEFLPDQAQQITSLAMAMLQRGPEAADDVVIARAS